MEAVYALLGFVGLLLAVAWVFRPTDPGDKDEALERLKQSMMGHDD